MPNLFNQVKPMFQRQKILLILFICTQTSIADTLVTQGSSQLLSLNETSTPVEFTLLDDLGNPISGISVNLNLTTPLDSSAQLQTANTTTNAQGTITTTLTQTDQIGTYQIQAQTGTQQTIAYIFVTNPYPDLPLLGITGEAISADTTGTPLTSDTIFQAGISLYGQSPATSINIPNTTNIFVQGIINTDPQHIGKQAEMIVAGNEIVDNTTRTFSMIDKVGQFIPWDGELSTLIPFKDPITLSDKEFINIYGGQIQSNTQLATVSVWFGYRLLETGIIVVNQQPLLFYKTVSTQ